MKPFDLEAAKRGEPIITRDGRSVEFIAHKPEAGDWSVCAFTGKICAVWRRDGVYVSSQLASDYDLFMAPKKRTVWVNLYAPASSGGCYGTSSGHLSNESADIGAAHDRIGGKAYPIEIEE